MGLYKSVSFPGVLVLVFFFLWFICYFRNVSLSLSNFYESRNCVYVDTAFPPMSNIVPDLSPSWHLIYVYWVNTWMNKRKALERGIRSPYIWGNVTIFHREPYIWVGPGSNSNGHTTVGRGKTKQNKNVAPCASISSSLKSEKNLRGVNQDKEPMHLKAPTSFWGTILIFGLWLMP